ncbi:hypothetical protein F4780DRAFT_233342 [Xylariomycetidae sp. FL0641]|nr:hypothetical protein F4780DRAFT_233342 [Xylariomycetidae sp. FL0641]
MASRQARPSFGQYDFALRDPPPNVPPRRARPDHRPSDRDRIRLPEVEIETDSDDDIPVSKPKRPASHGRSMSHPFPSLFSSRKKKNAVPDNQPSAGDMLQERSYHLKPQSNPTPTPNQRRVPPGPADFATGNCMTCASLVRWPKELHVFRCTICMTINDTQPYSPTPPSNRPGGRPNTRGSQSHSNGASPAGPSPQIPHSISTDHTKTLVKSCLRSALQNWLATRGKSHQATPWPDQSSMLSPTGYISRQGSPFKPDFSPSSSATPPHHVDESVFDEFAHQGLEPNPLNNNQNMSRSYSTSYPDTRSSTFPIRPRTAVGQDTNASPQRSLLDPKRIFKKVEDYLILCFGSHTCVNNSFVPRRVSVSSRMPPEIPRKSVPEPRRDTVREEAPISELDPKLLLLGNFAENGSWWTGGQDEATPTRVPSRRHGEKHSIVTARSPRIDWGEVMEWYQVVNNAAELLSTVKEELQQTDTMESISDEHLQQFEKVVLDAQEHLQRTLLKCTEMLLKRPGRMLVEPQDVRFLLLLLANPVLLPGYTSYTGSYQRSSKGKQTVDDPENMEKSSSGRHSGIIKRILGLLANSSESCHHHLVTWFSRLPEHLFLQIKDLVGGFVTYRLNRQSERTVEQKIDVTGGLIPQMPIGRASTNPASLHAALETSNSSKKQKQPAEPKRAAYTDDWQIKAGARVMSLMFSANNLTHVRRRDAIGGRTHGPLLQTSDFYNTLVDFLDFKGDFELWESKRGKFTFCQFPFFLSIWAKIQILEFDAKRQMAGKAREAFFDSILTHKNYAQYLVLSIRRECLVDDSLKKVSEVVGSGSEDIKKGLRIEFHGEEGVDGGGLRKEWFLLLVREVFNPDHGLFVYDEDSRVCYFNPNTFETSDQFFLVGVVLGLAIYNSTILDVALPPFAFRKLLASAPPPAAGSLAHSRPTMTYTLDDLAEFRPALARGLRQLLEFDGDVQATFCLDFVVEVERYGSRTRVPLCPGGENKMVTNANRREYVDLYVRYLLDTSVSRQFEPFKRGFFTVCAGNALTLFRPEEIELLIRGSDEPLNIGSLKGAAEYTNWPKRNRPEAEPTVQWFWDTFERATPQEQRRLLSFITGSDRIPAVGAASLVIRINCLGEDEGRFPSARTCFNILSLYNYRSRERLERSLWRAVNESEGFGLK